MDIKVRVIKNFNDELGSTLKNLKKIEQIHRNLEYEESKVKESLSLASSEAPSIIKENVEEVNQIVNCIDQVKLSCQSACKNISKRLQQENKTAELQTIIDNISYLEKSSLYLQFVKFIEDLSTELEVSLLSGNDEACVASYVILKETCQKLESSSCTNLKNYIQDTLEYWYDEIKKKLTGEYKEILNALKWPFVGANANASNMHSHESLARFRIITEHLFHLQLPHYMIKHTTTDILASFKPVCLPVTLLVLPLKQRFFYHFTGTKQTNRRDKPEWFLTQVLTYIRTHCEWVEKMVQPISHAAGFHNINVKVEFMRSLVQLAVVKLNSELSVVQYDDSLFAHTVDEALGFERELRESLLYPSSELATIFVLIQAPIFLKWITVEKKYATEKMDAILSSETAWSRLAAHQTDNMKVTECAEAFLTLLSTISDRYNHLPQPGHRLQFLDLQLELIDDWRVRLLQLLHEDYKDPLSSLKPPIFNTLYYVSCVLQDWGVTVPFLKLYFFKKQCEDADIIMHESILSESFIEESEKDITVFDEAVSLLQRLEKKLMTEICDSVFMEVKAKSRSYCNEKWFALVSEKEVASLSVTSSACPMFQEIVNRLHALHNVLALPLFQQSWKSFASRIDQHLFDELILRNQFNTGGVAQLQFDIKRNLLPIFSLYTDKPESYFPLIVEACVLLNMLIGSAILLLEALENEEENIKEILADVNIYQLSPHMVFKVLKTRMDLSTR